MIGQLSGKIISKNPPEILLEVAGGVGYEVLCPMSAFHAISGNTNIILHTHLNTKSEQHTLYGFITKDEKTLFRQLIKVNSVGPKVALAILSHLNSTTLINCIINKDVLLLAETPGIGKKTAQKIIVELKDRLAKSTVENDIYITDNPNIINTYNALQKLGFKIKEIKNMLAKIDNTSLPTKELIRLALQNK